MTLSKGFFLQTADGRDMVARLARGDVNMPNFDGFPVAIEAAGVRFESAVYELLRGEPDIRSSRLLYSRAPVQHPGQKLTIPRISAAVGCLSLRNPKG